MKIRIGKKLIKENAEIKQFPQKDKAFNFSASEVDTLNSAIAKIVNAAKNILGAEGEVPFFDAETLESAETTQRMVAEGDEDFSEDEIQMAQSLGITPQQLRLANPEQLELRKQFYDKSGVMGRPRAARDQEKGIGRMGVEDFESSGYVIRVPEKVLRDFQELVQSTKEIGGLYEEARDWYHNIRGLLDRETKNDRDGTLLGLLIATYSPRAKFALNLAEAVFMYKAVQRDVSSGRTELLKKYMETFAGSEKRTPGEFRGFTGAHKVPNFALNLIAPNLAGGRDDLENVVFNDLYEWNSTIDTWMIDAFYPSLRKASTAKEWEKIKGSLMSNVMSYRYMARLVAKQAKELNILPHELQALVWVSMQIRQTGEAGLGVTTQFAFDQLRQSISDIAILKEDLAALKDLEEKDWMGTIISTIERSGFEEASRYVREKQLGIRSVTGRGKRGKAFGFFPTTPKVKLPRGAKKAAAAKKPARPKPPKRYQDPAFSELDTFYVMNNVIQMPSGKFNNLYDSITLYLDPDFSTDKAVEHILGRFDPDATASKDYFTEGLSPRVRKSRKIRIAIKGRRA